MKITVPDSAFTIGLICLVAAYALLAGLKSLTDYDLGWQLATGRWILQHHAIPSTELFSYTAKGLPWIYPALSEIVFYLIFKTGGYAFLCWMGAFTCVAVCCILLWRASLFSAALLIFAVPTIAARVEPRADIFTALFFAVFVSLLWWKRRSRQAPMWILPVLMVLWVNLHLGFVAGLAAVAMFAVAEAANLTEPDFRWETYRSRLANAVFWLASTFLATLVNPWGWGIYRAVLRQNEVSGLHGRWITEWGPTTLTWESAVDALNLRDTRGGFLVLLFFAALAIIAAVRHRHFDVAVVLVGTSYIGIRHGRFQALCASVIVITAGTLLTDAVKCLGLNSVFRSSLHLTIFCFGVVVLAMRSSDIISNRTYMRSTSTASFGTGLSWWFPERAAEFVERENVPKQLFNSYNMGGYLTWRLGPKYPDYIDGRAIPFGPALFRRQDDLMHLQPDSPEWQQESQDRGIRSIIVSLGRYDGLQLFPFLKAFCDGNVWVPVYLDEVAAVFVKHSAETDELIQRSRINCSTVPLPAEALSPNPYERFNQWANSAAVLLVLGRTGESLSAAEKALTIFPESGNVHYIRAKALASLGQPSQAEEEYLTAVKLEPSEGTWAALAQMYRSEGKRSAAIDAFNRAVKYAPDPHLIYVALAYTLLEDRRPQEALNALDKAVQSRPPADAALASDKSFDLNVARGRSLGFYALGEIAKAISSEQEAIRIAPSRPDLWQELANLYRIEGNNSEAQKASAHAESLSLSKLE